MLEGLRLPCQGCKAEGSAVGLALSKTFQVECGGRLHGIMLFVVMRLRPHLQVELWVRFPAQELNTFCVCSKGPGISKAPTKEIGRAPTSVEIRDLTFETRCL